LIFVAGFFVKNTSYGLGYELEFYLVQVHRVNAVLWGDDGQVDETGPNQGPAQRFPEKNLRHVFERLLHKIRVSSCGGKYGERGERMKTK